MSSRVGIMPKEFGGTLGVPPRMICPQREGLLVAKP
jgi:hypothetical protein